MQVLESWREERQSAWLYRIVAAAEPDPEKSALFLHLADAAEAQALTWEAKMLSTGVIVPTDFHPSARAQLVARLIRRLGPRAMWPVLAAMKVRGISIYTASRAHTGHLMPTSIQQVGLSHKGVSSGGNLRAAVFGVNDGLVSNASLIMGMAGATSNLHLVLLTGIAGLLAGAFSMAAGEFISMRSQRELFEYQIGLERDELEEYPEEEAEELALIYHARGLPLEEARRVAQELLKNPEHALDTLAREELGLNPDALGSPWGAAIASFLAFAVGGAIPLLPLAVASPQHAIPVSALCAGIALFSVGAVLSLFTGRGAWGSGLRMVLIGGSAGVVTFLVGRLLGVSLA